MSRSSPPDARHRYRLRLPQRSATAGPAAHPPLSAYLGVLLNAAFYGLISVALPITLVASGATKGQIAAFFAIGAVAAAGLNLLGGPALRRQGSPWWGVSVSGAIGAVASAVVWGAAPSPLMYLAGAAIMTMALIFPHYVATTQRDATVSAARLVGRLRRVFVIGFICGLALASAGEFLRDQTSFEPMWLAIALAAGNASIPLFQRSVTRSTAPEPDGDGNEPGAVKGFGAILAIAAAVLLLRAADSVRLVYLPLYAVNNGMSGTFVGALFFVSVVIEVPLLGPISSLADRIGSRRTLVLIAASGVLSFGLLTAGSGYLTVIASQIVYAIFAAGFQVVGMVLLGQVLGGGLGAGADVYTSIFNIGAVVGVLAPLLVPGYSPLVFLVGGAMCFLSLAILALLPLPRSSTLPRRGTDGVGQDRPG